jgi:hypothetical protein
MSWIFQFMLKPFQFWLRIMGSYAYY